MDKKEFSMLELYDVAIRALEPIQIGNNCIERGEAIAVFDKIAIANFKDFKSIVTAHGGFDDRPLVFWESVKDINLSFVQGVFSKTQLQLVTNSKLYNETPSMPIMLSRMEEVECNDKGLAQLSRLPAPNTRYFIYDKKTGQKLGLKIDPTGKIEHIPYTSLIVDYYYLYRNGYSFIHLGRELFNGFVQLQGKTRLQDDETGQIGSVFLTIPKLKILSNIMIDVGKTANPMRAQFNAIACPVGDKGNKTVMELTFLKDDVDADIE